MSWNDERLELAVRESNAESWIQHENLLRRMLVMRFKQPSPGVFIPEMAEGVVAVDAAAVEAQRKEVKAWLDAPSREKKRKLQDEILPECGITYATYRRIVQAGRRPKPIQ